MKSLYPYDVVKVQAIASGTAVTWIDAWQTGKAVGLQGSEVVNEAWMEDKVLAAER